MPHRARAGKEIVLVAGNWLRDLDEKEEPGPDFENGKALHLPPSVLHGLARLCLRSIYLGCILGAYGHEKALFFNNECA